MSDLARYRINHPSTGMEVEFSCWSNGSMSIGTGQTRSLDPVEAVFQADRQLPCPAEVELRVRWPYLLQGVCPLELCITGRVIQSDESATVVHIQRYEFRTRGEHSFDIPVRRGATCNVVA